MGEWVADKCPECGAKIDPNDGKVAYCKYCGARLRMETNETIHTHNYKSDTIDHALDMAGSFVKHATIAAGKAYEEYQEEQKRKTQSLKSFFVVLLFLSPVIFIFGMVAWSVNNEAKHQAAQEARVKAAEERLAEFEEKGIPYGPLPLSTASAIGCKYEDIVAQLENAGFTNVSCVGTTNAEGEKGTVVDLVVEGYRFNGGALFPYESPIVVFYIE